MRNTLLPLIAAVVCFAIGLVLIRPIVDRGQGGPEVNAGILRLPKRDPLRTMGAPLAGSTAATVERGGRDDGLWRVVVVAGEDREPTTRAAMLALGESLFTAGMVVVMDPLPAASEPTPPLPMPTDRVISIATRSADIGNSPTADWQASIAFTVTEPRLPGGHPAEGLLAPPELAPVVILVEHAGRPAADAAAVDWPTRWAGTGRTIVQAMLGSLLPPSGLQRAKDQPLADWGTPVPFPPVTGELRWSGCFQHDLARGWVGRIAGRTVGTKSGGSEAASAPVIGLLRKGAWEDAAAAEGGWRQWSRLRDGQRQFFALRDDGDGWTCTVWTERPDVAGLIDRWIAAGDASARQHLQQLLTVRALPEPLRLRVEQALK